jgi:hypothetical protein
MRSSFPKEKRMTAALRVMLLLVVLAISACNLANTADLPTQSPAVTPDTAVSTQIAVEPTVSDFDVEVTETSLDATSESDFTGQSENLMSEDVTPGHFRLTVSGDVDVVFESEGTGSSAALVDQGTVALLRFRLGENASSLFAQEIGIMVPADIEPGEFLLRGSFGLDALTGDEDDSDVPMEGRVTIEDVSPSSISGSFEFTATTGGASPTVVTATFNQIPRVTE